MGFEVAVRKNSTNIDETVSSTQATTTDTGGTSYAATLCACMLVDLDASDVIDLAIASTGSPTGGLTVTIGDNADAYLSVKKIDD